MPVLYFDTTKYRRQSGHHSGLNRVSESLHKALAQEPVRLKPVAWSVFRRDYRLLGEGKGVGPARAGEAFFTPEVFALRERPFLRPWMKAFQGSKLNLFYDAIPWFRPETTWPRSVRRFPRWYQDLQAYDLTLFISEEAREAAQAVHRQSGMPAVDGPVLPLGADYREAPLERIETDEPVLLNVGIIEPRKGQQELLAAAERLWRAGHRFRLVLLGRVNPHYGGEVMDIIRRLQGAGHPLIHEPMAGDDRLAYWHQRASLTVLPSQAEGFGLPVLEALWAGSPVLCSRQPSVGAVPAMAGLRVLEGHGAGELESVLEALLGSADALRDMAAGIRREAIPTWRHAARQLLGYCFS